MSGHRKWAEIRTESNNPDRQARVFEEKRIMGLVMTLQEMREQLGVSQEDLARAWETSQPNVSKIEHKDDLLFSTVRRYVEALGGRLDVQAVFADRLINLQFGEDDHSHQSPLPGVTSTPIPSLSTTSVGPGRHSESDPGR